MAADVREARKSISVRIRQLRNRRGWSIKDLAERAHLSAKHVHMVEKGRRNASLNAICEIATALGVDWTEVLRRPDPEPPPPRKK